VWWLWAAERGPAIQQKLRSLDIATFRNSLRRTWTWPSSFRTGREEANSGTDQGGARKWSDLGADDGFGFSSASPLVGRIREGDASPPGPRVQEVAAFPE
jgi:hypothetical protein